MPPYPRSKPHLAVATIGHLGAGKTALTAALSARLAYTFEGRAYSYRAVANGGYFRDEGNITSVRGRAISYETERRHYTHVDCPGHPNFVKTATAGLGQVDAAVLVVSAVDGVMPQTREHLFLARALGVEQVAVFLSKIDHTEDAELLDLAELETRQALNQAGFPGDDVPFIRGNALAAVQSWGWDEKACRCIDELVAVMEAHFHVPPRATDKPVLFGVTRCFQQPGSKSGLRVGGRVLQGTAEPGTTLDVSWLGGQNAGAVLTGATMFEYDLEEVRAGDNAGLILRGLAPWEVHRGQVMGEVGSLRLTSWFEARITLLPPEEGGRRSPIRSGFTPLVYFHTASLPVRLSLLGQDACRPGESARVRLVLPENRPLPLEVGQTFPLRDECWTMGLGTVTAVEECA